MACHCLYQPATLFVCLRKDTSNFRKDTSDFSKAHVTRDSSCPATLAISVGLQQ